MQNALTLDWNAIIRLAWIILAAVAITALSFTTAAVVAFTRVPPGMNPAFTLSKMFGRAKALEMITVILIIIAAVFLAMLRIIDSNGVVGILSGIAGYVLGGIRRGPEEDEEEKKKEEKK